MATLTEAELKEKFEHGIQLFYDDVLEKKDLRHFFFGINMQKLIDDYYLYKDFVMTKPDRYYKEMVMQTCPSDIQVKAPQFDEILISLRNNLKIAGYSKLEIPKFSVHILEVMEETRAQKSDAEVKVWKPFEVTNELISDLYNKNRTDARVEKNGDVYGTRGFLYPFWTRVSQASQEIILIGQAFAASAFTPVAEIQTLCDQINEKITHQAFSVREGPNGAVLFARHSFSYAKGVPVRMLVRAAKQFSSSFEAGMNMDVNKLLARKSS
jgi:hypothetical protein